MNSNAYTGTVMQSETLYVKNAASNIFRAQCLNLLIQTSSVDTGGFPEAPNGRRGNGPGLFCALRKDFVQSGGIGH